jgi:four helix bundle protein
MRNDKSNMIVKLTFEFSLDILKFCHQLENSAKYLIAKQLFKSGTSIGANVFEAQNAESRADFIHKMKIAAKEADETFYWISLCNESEHYPTNQEILQKLQSIITVLSKIISTIKKAA